MPEKIKKAVHIKENGDVNEVVPKNGKKFTLQELYEYTGCTCVQWVPLPSGFVMICDDNGRDNREVNAKASDVWNEEYPIKKYPHNNPQDVYGDVLISPAKFVD